MNPASGSNSVLTNVMSAVLVLLIVIIATVVIKIRRSRAAKEYLSSQDFLNLAAQQGWRVQRSDDELFLRRGLDHLFGDFRALDQHFGSPSAVRSAPVLWAVVGQNPQQEIIATQTNTRGWVDIKGVVTSRVTVSGVRHSAYLVQLPRALPTVNFLPEGLGGKAATMLRLLADQDTESYQFNEQRRVISADDRLAHAILNPVVLEAVLAGPAKASLQIVGNYLVSFERGGLTLERAAARTAWLRRVAAGIPAFVFNQYGQD